MKKFNRTLLTGIALVAFSTIANGHDPKLHIKKSVKANCAPLEKMKKENKKMNMTDPVMIAMMKKCDKQTRSKQIGHKEHKGEHSEQAKHEKMTHQKTTEKEKGDKHNH